jgi:hypothetical protein
MDQPTEPTANIGAPTAANLAVALLVLVSVAAFSAGSGYLFGIHKATVSQTVKTPNLDISPGVEKAIQPSLDELIRLGKEQALVAEAKQANVKNQKLTPALINQLDQNWQKSDSKDEVIVPFLSNAAALALLQFQEKQPDFTEIFATDGRGLNIAMTNKTSDYLQADEDWWVKAFSDGTGKSFHGHIEFDESSQTEAIALYAPILSDGKAIGVIKALLDVNSVKYRL